jgi:pimeloyl-ACP methyl ester carboxylesterase
MGLEPKARHVRTMIIAISQLARRFTRAVLVIASVLLASQALADDTTQLAVHVEGTGTPTIVLVSGLGDTLDVWAGVQTGMSANCAMTFAFTRAGYEGSAPASGPRDAAAIVGELRTELQHRKIPQPYVLVGHSLGGLYTQYFARQFPSEVRGLLLIDSTHWNQQLPTALGAPSTYGRPGTFLYMPFIMRRELADSALAGEQVHESPAAGDIPTIVLSRTRPLNSDAAGSETPPAVLQQEIAADFPRATHVNVANSGHYIQRDQPAVVINSARQLSGCAPL